MREPGRLIASGRDADIFEYGPGRVLRRSRSGRSIAEEARIMAHVRTLGYPAPEVFESSDDGCDLVIERIDGPIMLDAAAARPWRLRALARTLADLHHSLHELAAPDWLRDAPVSQGSAILHLDLHPLNVLMSSAGPVVIDWANATRGNPSVDVCLTWAVLAAGEPPANPLMSALLKVARGQFLSAFLKAASPGLDTSVLAAVVEWKAKDPHLSPQEISRMRALV